MELPLEKIEYVSCPFDFYFENKSNTCIMYQDEYRGHLYKIFSNGSYPMVYLEVDRRTYINRCKICYKLLNVIHGGIQYEQDNFIGWDFARYQDYVLGRSDNDNRCTKIWTFADVLMNIKKAIDTLEYNFWDKLKFWK